MRITGRIRRHRVEPEPIEAEPIEAAAAERLWRSLCKLSRGADARPDELERARRVADTLSVVTGVVANHLLARAQIVNEAYYCAPAHDERDWFCPPDWSQLTDQAMYARIALQLGVWLPRQQRDRDAVLRRRAVRARVWPSAPLRDRITCIVGAAEDSALGRVTERETRAALTALRCWARLRRDPDAARALTFPLVLCLARGAAPGAIAPLARNLTDSGFPVARTVRLLTALAGHHQRDAQRAAVQSLRLAVTAPRFSGNLVTRTAEIYDRVADHSVIE